MKHLILGLFFLSFVFIGCSDSNDMELDKLSGTYVGTIEGVNYTKSSDVKSQGSFTAEIRVRGNLLEVNCIGPQFNAEFMLEYYEHNGGYMVCLTGDDYKNLYGSQHRIMNGNHMNGMQTNGTPWMNHLNNAHQSNEHHSNGAFDLSHHTFVCTFSWNDQPVTFNGIKQ